ncbi:hypothetical protein B0J17DRAFT_428188 [Rhizoctonia solani]|nr:hypothetical protein B0J17DRAFT_428188 [Rhizoctonia solani]
MTFFSLTIVMLAALSIILVLNDAFMLTIDYKRTNTYVGCVATQVIVSISAIIINTLALSLQPEWATYTWLLLYQAGAKYFVTYHRSGIGFLMIGIPTLWASFLSLCLLGVVLRPVYLLRHSVSVSRLWKQNTKEVLMRSTILSKTDRGPSISGHPREVPLLVTKWNYYWRKTRQEVLY